MATVADYFDIADLVYHKGGNDRHLAPVGFSVSARSTSKWYQNGFRGAVCTSASETIIAFSGTRMRPFGPSNQHSANVLIAFKTIPFMAASAYDFAKEHLTRGSKVSVVGHSLGGSLAQVVGPWLGVAFINFGGPGMARALNRSTTSIFRPTNRERSRAAGEPMGINFIARGDSVGSYGEHVGRLQMVDGVQSFKHSLINLKQALGADAYRYPTHWEPMFGNPAQPIARVAPRLSGDFIDAGPSLSELLQGDPNFRGH